MTPEPLATKLSDLEGLLRQAGRVAVALSGGVDSSFLAALARRELGREDVLAVTVRAPFFPEWELEDARRIVREYDIRHVEVEGRVLHSEHFAKNPPDRCYHCKRALMTELIRVAGEDDIHYVADGTNADDDDDFRPGMRATAELGIEHPLREAGLTKEDLRKLSRRMGLHTHDKPSAACLASRVPYGEPITADVLACIERAEQALHRLGFRAVRVRTHGNLARIELHGTGEVDRLLDPELRGDVVDAVRDAGYAYVALDLEGYRTGSMNEQLTDEERTEATTS